MTAAHVQPRWLKLKAAEVYCSLNEKTIRRRIKDGSIRSKMVKAEGTNRGVRLVDRLSLDEFIEGCGDEHLPLAMNEKGGEK